jgi:hypothetical protein
MELTLLYLGLGDEKAIFHLKIKGVVHFESFLHLVMVGRIVGLLKAFEVLLSLVKLVFKRVFEELVLKFVALNLVFAGQIAWRKFDSSNLISND